LKEALNAINHPHICKFFLTMYKKMWFILTDIQDIHSLTTTFVYCQFMSTWLKYWACVTHLSFCFEETYYRTFHRCFPPIFGSFCYAVSEKKIFRNWLIWNKNCLWWPCLFTDRDEVSNRYRGPFNDASYHVLVHLAKRFKRSRFFRN
jgi:hypothetical protein